jgi:hypothetical protein
MTYDEEPTRWTASPEQAPELLRGAFAASRNEGPSKTQMQALALKIAALSAGSAVAIGTAKAAAGSQVAASAATWSLGKLAGVLILAGGIATGAVIWNRSPQPSLRAAQVLLPPLEESPEPVIAAPQQAHTQPVEPTSDARAPIVTSLSPPPAREEEVAANQLTTASASAVRVAPARAVAARRHAASARAARSAKVADLPAPRREPAAAGPEPSVAATEIELLRQAQLALSARPREAFQLTEEHRKQYPDGEFALERDVLAIQALIRAGNPTMARDLAESFLKAHPDSPHAHRFREAMGIH